ncbi:response regulator [Paenibacillus methanolicus]|uniref:Two-component system response regulator YesN n=1 Tax=Paenibacillus methanolicus TaxID=582686 RepID=A0A5S5C8M1_9BACL|nr:response regulator [Paenibacillus methanolicus]TYP74832.1 two-component system response regulator YesN [Paenibacillus methanolicus]
MTLPWSLCVIDDIAAVIDGISRSVRWEEHGIALAGTATDGEEGWRLIERTVPDIVITDIRMPKLDGMALTERVKARFPRCKIIFITGFTDFEYAQQALKLGAFDFIAKPFSLGEIVEAVLKARAALEAERGELDKRRELEQRVQASLPTLRREFMQTLMHHRGSEAAVAERWRFLDIPLAPANLIVMAIEIDAFEERRLAMPAQEAELLRFTLQNIVEETIAGYAAGIVFRETMDRFVAVFNEAEGISPMEIAEQCCRNIATHSRFTVSIGVGLIAAGVEELADAYRQALDALSYHFYTGGNGALGYEDAGAADRGRAHGTLEGETELLYSIRCGNAEKASLLLNRLFAEHAAASERPEPDYMISVYDELAFMMARVLQEIVPQGDAAELVRQVRERPMSGARTIRKEQERLTRLSGECCRLIERMRAGEASTIIEQSVRYIREHLSEELTVQNGAKQVHLSPSYFANLFKKTTGMPYMQFVTQERVELAKKMLLDGYQVQEVTHATGYGDRRYFSEVFKKLTGATPTEFRASMMAGKPE